MSLASLAAKSRGHCSQNQRQGGAARAHCSPRRSAIRCDPSLIFDGLRPRLLSCSLCLLRGLLSLRGRLVCGLPEMRAKLIELLLDSGRNLNLRGFVTVIRGKIRQAGGGADEAAGGRREQHKR